MHVERSKRKDDYEELEMYRKKQTKKTTCPVDDKPSPCPFFPPIVKRQFISGNDKYIPPLPDKIA